MRRRHGYYQTLLARRRELRPAAEARLVSHLGTCDECRRHAEEFAAQDGEVRLLGQARSPSGLRDAVLAVVDSEGSAARESLRFGRLIPTSALALVIVIAGVLGFALLRHTSTPRTETALAQKGYVLLSSSASPSIHRAMAERIALAFFPGTVRSVTLAHVSNLRSAAFGQRGRLCWIISITTSASLLARPGDAWLDGDSPSQTGGGSFSVFVDAHLGNFVLASSAA